MAVLRNPEIKEAFMEYSKKMVSVVIPVYQSKKYITYCVESVLNQTYKNMEIILVDDGSDDGSGEMCDAYSHKYSNIFCIHQKNKGVSSARNVGISSAGGEYILFVDSDDYIESDYLKNAVSRLENECVDMYLCGYQNVRNNGKVKEKKYYPSINDALLQHDELISATMKLFNSSTLHAIGTKVYKKSIIEKYGIRFYEKWMYYEDIYFCLNYLRHCNQIYVQKKVMYYYQKDICNSLSKQSKNYKYESILKTYTLLYRLINGNRISDEERNFFYKSYLTQINLCLNSTIKTENRYTANIHKLYKMLSKDIFYKDTISLATNTEKNEYFFVRNGLFILAYFIRKYMLYEY